MHKSTGTICYGPGIKAFLLVDQGIADFYRSLIPKWIPNSPQRYKAHISFVRHENPPLMQFWDKYAGQKLDFQYDTIIHRDETYFWLNAICPDLESIRVELGLPAHPWWRNKFHITLANCKEFQHGTK